MSEGAPVNVSISNPPVAYTTIRQFSGSDLVYEGIAKSMQPTATFIISGGTPYALTSIVVSTNVGTVTTVSDNGLKVNDKIVVTGATGDTDLNATYKIATVTNSKVFTIATVSVTDGTYNNAGLQFTTTAPRTTQPIWGIKKYTGAVGVVTAIQWANGSNGGQIWDNRATLAFQ